MTIKVRYTVQAPPIPSSLARYYKHDAVSKYENSFRIDWSDLQTLELADRCLKALLETTCHIYTNDEHTWYYDPASIIEPYHKPQVTMAEIIRSFVSVKPDIAALVERQVEEDKLWRQRHGATN